MLGRFVRLRPASYFFASARTALVPTWLVAMLTMTACGSSAPADEPTAVAKPPTSATPSTPPPPTDESPAQATDPKPSDSSSMPDPKVDPKPEPNAGSPPDAKPDAPTTKPESSTKPSTAPKKAKPKPSSDTDPPQDDEADANASSGDADGRALYMRRCKNCHGKSGEADTKMGAKHDIESWKQAGWRSKWTLAKIEAIVRDGKPDTKMKSFAEKLSADEIKAVSVYARSLGK